MTNEPRTGDVTAACSGQIDTAETHDNGQCLRQAPEEEVPKIQCLQYVLQQYDNLLMIQHFDAVGQVMGMGLYSKKYNKTFQNFHLGDLAYNRVTWPVQQSRAD